MVVRLHWHDLHVDLELSDGIISRVEAPALLGMDAAVSQLMQAAQTHLLEAQAKAATLLSDAEQAVQIQRECALEDARIATQQGYAQGKEQAQTDWLEQACKRQKEVQKNYLDHRDYLAHWVVEAVRAMVHGHAVPDFFLTALSSLDTVAEKDNAVVLHVHPNDQSAAQKAITLARVNWPDEVTIRIEADSALTPLSCRIETATAFIDASLDVQLRALRRRLQSNAFDQTLKPPSFEVLT